MKKILLLTFMLGTLNACNGFKKLTDGSTQPNMTSPTLPNDYFVTGVTSTDKDLIAPVRCKNSVVKVWVKIPGALDYREAYRVEFYADTVGAGGGGVYFENEYVSVATLNGEPTGFVLTGRPLAPKGTAYKIESTLIGE